LFVAVSHAPIETMRQDDGECAAGDRDADRHPQDADDRESRVSNEHPKREPEVDQGETGGHICVPPPFAQALEKEVN
jgi:hypothetical protein